MKFILINIFRSDVLAVNKPVFYQGISTTNWFSDEFINWLKDSCWDSVDENDLVNKLNNTIIPKLDKTTDKCIIRAARFDMPTPP